MIPATAPLPKWRRILTHVIRVLTGLAFTVFGLNGFLNFLQPPPDMVMPEGAAAFTAALMATGYMMKLIGTTQLVSGLLLLSGRFVPLALVLLAPFLVNALCFHLVLEPTGLPNTLVFIVFELYLAWTYRSAYRPLLTARATLA